VDRVEVRRRAEQRALLGVARVDLRGLDDLPRDLAGRAAHPERTAARIAGAAHHAADAQRTVELGEDPGAPALERPGREALRRRDLEVALEDLRRGHDGVLAGVALEPCQRREGLRLQ